MQKLFSPDSGFMRGLSRAADLVILNILFLVCCIPVVTVGPAVTALYTVVFAMGTSRESGTVIPYFRAFRENFKTAVLVWLVLLAVGVLLALDVTLAAKLGGVLASVNVVFWILLILEWMAGCIVFPMMSLFQNTVKGTIRSGLVIALGQLPRTLAVSLLWALPWIVLARMPLTFFNAAFIWIAVYFAAAAYFSSLLLRKVFAPFLPEDAFEEDTV